LSYTRTAIRMSQGPADAAHTPSRAPLLLLQELHAVRIDVFDAFPLPGPLKRKADVLPLLRGPGDLPRQALA